MPAQLLPAGSDRSLDLATTLTPLDIVEYGLLSLADEEWKRRAAAEAVRTGKSGDPWLDEWLAECAADEDGDG